MATRGESLTPAGLALGRAAGVRGRPLVLAAGGIAALAVALVLGVGFGSVSIDPADTVAILAQRLLGIDLGREYSAAAETIVMDLRLPRVLTAMLVGLALAVAGVTFQGLLRNPLADPYVLGTSSGAALGAAIAVLIPVRIAILELGLLQVFAFVGALLAIYTVYKLSRTTGLAPLTSLLLTGYAVGSLLAAGLAMAMYLSGAAAPPDLHVPARQLRRGQLDPPRLGAADRRDRDRRHPPAGADAQRAAARRGDGGEPRRQRGP